MIASLALGQSYNCPNASQVTMKDMGKHDGTELQQNTQKH